MRPHAPDFLFILKDTYLREAADGPGVRWRSPVRRFTNICAFLVAQSRCGCQQRLWISMIHMKIGKKTKKNPTTYRVEIWICSAFNQLYYFRKLTCFSVWQTNWAQSPNAGTHFGRFYLQFLSSGHCMKLIIRIGEGCNVDRQVNLSLPLHPRWPSSTPVEQTSCPSHTPSSQAKLSSSIGEVLGCSESRWDIKSVRWGPGLPRGFSSQLVEPRRHLIISFLARCLWMSELFPLSWRLSPVTQRRNSFWSLLAFGWNKDGPVRLNLLFTHDGLVPVQQTSCPS